MKSKIRFGLYGCNMYRTRDLMDGARADAADAVEVVATYDIDTQKADHAADKYGGKSYRTEGEFLADGNVDVVLISLPPYLHADAFINTAKAGRDVYLEKPICVNREARDRVLDALENHPVRCYVGLSYRHVAPFRKVAEILRRPDAGRILGVHHHWLAPTMEPITDPARIGWRQRFDLSGGQLIHHCCHVLDWFYFLGGEFASLSASSYTPPDVPFPHEERELTACFNYSKGGMAVFNLSQHSHQYVQFGTVHAENLGVQYQWGKETFVRVFKTRSRAADETYEWSMTSQADDGGEADRNRLQMKEFIDAYLANGPMPITMEDGIRVFDLACAIRESYGSGRAIDVSKAGDRSFSF